MNLQHLIKGNMKIDANRDQVDGDERASAPTGCRTWIGSVGGP